MLIWLWWYARVAFWNNTVSTLETKFKFTIFPPWHRNDTAQQAYLWSGHPRQGLLVVSTLWDHPLGTGLLTQTSWPPPSGTTVQRNNNYTHAFIILALLFNHIFKFAFKYVNHPHFSKHSLLKLTIPFSMTCLKTGMFKTIWNPFASMERMYLFVPHACMIWEYTL